MTKYTANEAQSANATLSDGNTDAPSIGRREFVGGLVAASLLARAPGVFAQPAPLNFVSYGGSYGEAVNKHLVKPFEKESGLTVQQGVNQAFGFYLQFGFHFCACFRHGGSPGPTRAYGFSVSP